MQGLIDHGLAGQHYLDFNKSNCLSDSYSIYYGLGQQLDFIHSPTVFRVSLAGVRLGCYLLRSFSSSRSNNSFLDVGTGSGVHALLARKLGVQDIFATDISPYSIEQAKLHEHINFKQPAISFCIGDLFSNLPERQFETITFNPPGWRTPSPSLTQRLDIIEPTGQLPLEAMFYGEQIIARFLDNLPKYLAPTGTAIVGLNSLVGIRDVLNGYRERHHGAPPLAYRLMERHTLPLLYYSDHWQATSKLLKSEFEQWANQDLAAYSADKHGIIFWSYEIVEFYYPK
ncbi:50S ribosomal protein L11 methyltransferase [Pseudomonas sp. R3-52-08]|uniref:50S ribosomal protein L11 methyltransferase n=1 Tax=Pseudomonas sp. R3-52-08 TaxID=1173284 RepID=UPI000F57B01D|nr:50S ribosomal protein L11 methyltransferase [Pseudomonas sp. R3-52-08]AZF21247.1 hypothetical protein C4J91_2497 [Pseudomonas sp. R3-52-08]